MKKIYLLETGQGNFFVDNLNNVDESVCDAITEYVSQNDYAILMAERDELKAKLAEIDVCGIYNIVRDIVQNYECGDEVDNKLRPILAKLSQPIANNSEPVQRITEQDVRDIANNIFMECCGYKFPKVQTAVWFEEEGRNILAKLNEHRETVEKRTTTLNTDSEKILRDEIDRLSKRCEFFESAYQVTPNKGEVPD